MITLKKYTIRLKSLSPLVLNNDKCVDPLLPETKKIKEITRLKKKTDDHHLALSKLQWEASYYFDEEIGFYLPSRIIFGSWKFSARADRLGMQMKAVILDEVLGPSLMPYNKIKPKDLWEETNKKGERFHVYRAPIKQGKVKIMKTRCSFPFWEVRFNIFLNQEILEPHLLKTIIERAGFEYGVGELRPGLVTGICGRYSLEEMKET